MDAEASADIAAATATARQEGASRNAFLSVSVPTGHGAGAERTDAAGLAETALQAIRATESRAFQDASPRALRGNAALTGAVVSAAPVPGDWSATRTWANACLMGSRTAVPRPTSGDAEDADARRASAARTHSAARRPGTMSASRNADVAVAARLASRPATRPQANTASAATTGVEGSAVSVPTGRRVRTPPAAACQSLPGFTARRSWTVV